MMAGHIAVESFSEMPKLDIVDDSLFAHPSPFLTTDNDISRNDISRLQIVSPGFLYRPATALFPLDAPGQSELNRIYSRLHCSAPKAKHTGESLCHS
jgi:hypothetical protein